MGRGTVENEPQVRCPKDKKIDVWHNWPKFPEGQLGSKIKAKKQNNG